MKLNKNEVQYLTNFLNKELKYRETLDEIRDHILSALEQYPEDVRFESAFYDIINKQFKGVAGLRAIDRQYRKHGLTEMLKRYFNHITSAFKFPAVIYLAVVGAAAFFLFNYIAFNTLAHILLFVIISCLPGVIDAVRHYSAGYYYGSTKRSVSDEGFKLLGYFPGILFTVFAFCLWQMNIKLSALIDTLGPGVATVIFMFYVLHAAAYYKMYKEEFKFIAAR